MTVYKDVNDTHYFVTRVKLRNGKTKQIKRRGFKTPKEARLAEAQLLIDWENEETKDESMLFSEVALEYLSWYKKRRKESSYSKLSSLIRTHLNPNFGKRKIDAIRNRDITKFQDKLIDKHYSAHHVKKIHTTLSAVFNYAIKQEYIKLNPAAIVGNVDLEEERHVDYWTLEEFKCFLSKIDDPFYHTLFMTLYYSGMRKGEALALTWNDIDFPNNKITINKTYYKGNVTSVKTKASRRTIIMPEHTMSLLSDLQVAQGHKKLDYVVFGEVYDYTSTTTLDRYFTKYLKLSGLKKIRIHDFRHSHASYLINNNAIPGIVAQRLGHSDISTTLNIYSHLYPSTEKEAVLQMENDF
ncbi:site-specific integrase [Geomicrobium sediminis]|uniref:Integrase n=1 Tax=Geomicrobium sediminis TaxID=1347788 RepID=A0ABS2P8J4_9BACL|nr:site-specific integrase [Geomicrobium sediminis]MBM7631138.1 integrase [Geomicrobium sediminis]